MSLEMLDANISQISNEVDQTQFILYTEWASTSFKIMLFKSSEVPLMGEMLENDINYYSEEHSKTCKEYLDEIKSAFSGKDAGVQYFIQDDKFEWRRNKKWILGKITICPVPDILVISETLHSLLKRQQHLQEVLSKLRKENELLKDTKKELTNDIEEMIKMKSDMEKELYQKFLLVLNAKKKKIRELKNILKSKEHSTNSVFDECTDQSQDTDIDERNMRNRLNVKKRVQRLVSDESTDPSEDSDIGTKVSYFPYKKNKSNGDIKNKMKVTASTSKEMYKDIPDDARRVPVVSSVSSDESECDLELKMPESYTPMHPNTSRLDFEEESEEELFS